MAGDTARDTVLVLDDDPVVGELLGVLLRRAGLETVIVVDPTAALLAAAERAPSIVAAVCDLQLGTSNGADVLCALRPIIPAARAIVMSGHPAAHVEAELARAGIDAIVFQKPFRAADLVAAICAEAAPCSGEAHGDLRQQAAFLR